jgi:hypothetical protein
MNFSTTFDFKKHINRIILFLLVIFFISEVATKLAYRFDLAFHNYSALVKGFFAISILIYSILNRNYYIKKVLFFLSLIMIIFISGQYVFNSYSFGEHFFENFITLSRYVFVFILSLCFFRVEIQISNRVFYVFEKIIILNSLLIIIGALFEISFFETYTTRFGYNGFFMTPSTGTYFYALALTYFSYKYFYNGEKLLELLLVLLVCFLVGTKALLLFLALTALHLFVSKKLYKIKLLYIFAGSLLILFITFKLEIKNYLITKFDILFNLYNEQGLITMLTSMRDMNFKEDFIPLVTEKWNWLNFLFGGTDFEIYRVEFEIFDVFLFFGFVGSALYLWNYFDKIIIFKKLDTFEKLQLFFLLFVALLSGNFFNNAPVSLYLLLVLSFFYSKNHADSNVEK